MPWKTFRENAIVHVRWNFLNVLKTPLRMKRTSRTWPDKEWIHQMRNEHKTDTNE